MEDGGWSVLESYKQDKVEYEQCSRRSQGTLVLVALDERGGDAATVSGLFLSFLQQVDVDTGVSLNCNDSFAV